MKTNAFIASLLLLLTHISYAQVDESDSQMIEVTEPEISFQLEEVTQVVDFDKIQPVAYNNDEPAAYLVEKENGEKMILGVARDQDDVKGGIINAYLGAQTIFGVRAGIEILKNIQIGVHFISSGTGLFIDQVKRKGVHVNVTFLNLKFNDTETSFYVGARYNSFQKTHKDYGYYSQVLKGNTVDGLLGVNIGIDERQSFGIEVGYGQSVAGGLTNYEYGTKEIGRNIKYSSPLINLTYTIRLFKRQAKHQD